MPRRKLPVPATASSVLEYFATTNVEVAKAILDLATTEVAKRTPKGVPEPKPARRGAKKPPAAPEQYGESLKDA